MIPPSSFCIGVIIYSCGVESPDHAATDGKADKETKGDADPNLGCVSRYVMYAKASGVLVCRAFWNTTGSWSGPDRVCLRKAKRTETTTTTSRDSLKTTKKTRFGGDEKSGKEEAVDQSVDESLTWYGE